MLRQRSDAVLLGDGRHGFLVGARARDCTPVVGTAIPDLSAVRPRDALAPTLRAVTRANVRRTARRTLVTSKRAALEFVDDRGHRSAAQISFFAILSFIPLVLLLAALRPRLRRLRRARADHHDGLRQRPAEQQRRPPAARARGRRRARPGRQPRDLQHAARDRRGDRRDGRAAPLDQRGVGHRAAPAAAEAQGAGPRARARRDVDPRAQRVGDRHAPAVGHRRRRGRRRLAPRRGARRRRGAAAAAVRRARAAVPLPRAADEEGSPARHLAGRGRRRRSAWRSSRSGSSCTSSSSPTSARSTARSARSWRC